MTKIKDKRTSWSLSSAKIVKMMEHKLLVNYDELLEPFWDLLKHFCDKKSQVPGACNRKLCKMHGDNFCTDVISFALLKVPMIQLKYWRSL